MAAGRAVDGRGRVCAPRREDFWPCVDEADDWGLLGDPMPLTIAVHGRLRPVVDADWEPDLCVFCCEQATTMIILESGRHAVMICDECMNDDAVSLDDVPPERIMLVFIAHMN